MSFSVHLCYQGSNRSAAKQKKQAKSQQTRFLHFCWHFGNLCVSVCVCVCVSVLSITGHTKRPPPAESLQAWCDWVCVWALVAMCCCHSVHVHLCVCECRSLLVFVRERSALGRMVTLCSVLFMRVVTKTWLIPLTPPSGKQHFSPNNFSLSHSFNPLIA